MTLDKERLQTLKDKYLGVFGLRNTRVKHKQSKKVTGSSKWPNPFGQRISLGTELISTKAFLRTHGRGSRVTFTIFRLVVCIVLISVEYVDQC